ncbi:MAG: hypothetical protein ABSH06_20090 [Thermodesulfobacteriota bacterium]|jgi:hypothetical protein
MQTKSSDGSWFLIMCSWEMGADDVAQKRFRDVYGYLLPLAPPYIIDAIPEYIMKQVPVDPIIKGSNDPRLDLVPESLKSLNLIGRRRFVIICQIISNNCNRVLLALSRKISLDAPISVEIFPATYVHDLLIEIVPKNGNIQKSK